MDQQQPRVLPHACPAAGVQAGEPAQAPACGASMLAFAGSVRKYGQTISLSSAQTSPLPSACALPLRARRQSDRRRKNAGSVHVHGRPRSLRATQASGGGPLRLRTTPCQNVLLGWLPTFTVATSHQCCIPGCIWLGTGRKGKQQHPEMHPQRSEAWCLKAACPEPCIGSLHSGRGQRSATARTFASNALT